MEPGSTPLTDSGSPSPPITATSSFLLDQHGLNFGRKVYFEDHAAVPAAPPSPPANPAAVSTPSSSKKGKAAASSSGAGQWLVQEGILEIYEYPHFAEDVQAQSLCFAGQHILISLFRAFFQWNAGIIFFMESENPVRQTAAVDI
ncbi:hypothetical protein SAY86_007577 [Trapa natans]|uniref:Uncharacterized protein n=1 Tax=Trapa natans TaxID=22666 RepID=A0AAN7LHM7_TRANT|nr:hypothetical protein SAY86_007577 [Trapa natans]